MSYADSELIAFVKPSLIEFGVKLELCRIAGDACLSTSRGTLGC